LLIGAIAVFFCLKIERSKHFMSELNSTNAWPFTEIPAEERLDINAIFGDSTDTANQGNPFEVQATAAAPAPAPATQEMPAAPAVEAAAPMPAAAPPRNALALLQIGEVLRFADTKLFKGHRGVLDVLLHTLVIEDRRLFQKPLLGILRSKNRKRRTPAAMLSPRWR